jgi:hypothetical protein
MALDTLSVPTISTQYERVFSSTKKLVSPHRDSIKEDLICHECQDHYLTAEVQRTTAGQPALP